jgi:ubiquinone biosynthesis protein Coq4
MNYILFDDYSRNDLLPFTYTRPISEIRIGVLTITEKWEKYLNSKVSFHTQDFLSTKYKKQSGTDNIFINGKICPNKELLNLILNLKNNSAIKAGNDLLAFRTNENKNFDVEELLKSAIEIPENFI